MRMVWSAHRREEDSLIPEDGGITGELWFTGTKGEFNRYSGEISGIPVRAEIHMSLKQEKVVEVEFASPAVGKEKVNAVIVSPNKLMIKFAQKKGFHGLVVRYLKREGLPEGMNVVGSVPLTHINDLIDRGNRVFIPVLPWTTIEDPGATSVEELEKLGAKLVEIVDISISEVE